jgi:hypothetical protein
MRPRPVPDSTLLTKAVGGVTKLWHMDLEFALGRLNRRGRALLGEPPASGVRS